MGLADPFAMLRFPLVALFLLAPALAGCVAAPDEGLDPAAASPAAHVLAGTVEPVGLDAPGFDLLGAVARGGLPSLSAGEPSVWAHTDGSLLVSFPGCDRENMPFIDAPGDATCKHGIVYRSVDDGATWTRLNADDDGALDPDADAANGDADVTVDAAGVIYASDLGGGIQVFRSADEGASWQHIGNVVPENHWADRQWMAAAAPGQLVMTWMGGETPAHRAIAINSTFDGGKTWTGVTYLGDQVGWLGTVAFDVTGTKAFIPFTQSDEPVTTENIPGNANYDLLVAVSHDGGATWAVEDTGADVTRTATGLHWAGVIMAPALDVTGDGHVVYAWSEEVHDPSGVTALGSVVKFVASADDGLTWTAPVTLSTRANTIMPWVVGGAGDRFAVTWLANDAPGDQDYVGGPWDVEAVVVDGAGAATPQAVVATVEANVHVGGICARGGVCLLTGSDRSLLDFFESDVTPDGRLIVAYPADPLEGGKYVEMRVALQSSGTPLLAAPSAAPASAE